ncbi:MAG: YfiR family protein [Candidatus Zixiibacteriota bacterium]|nr:MAG: YfiR family protein [candidate division Zixibacteria bacterium]
MMRKTLLVVAVMLLSLGAYADDNSEKTVAFKAEFIVHLLDNVEWSKAEQHEDTDNITIYVVGECPVNGKLEEYASKESKDGKTIEVKVVSSADSISEADIVFVASDDLGTLAKVLKKVKGTHALTVSDAKDFARYGVMINFLQEEGSDKVKLEVNKIVLDNAGAKLNSKILEKAVLI